VNGGGPVPVTIYSTKLTTTGICPAAVQIAPTIWCTKSINAAIYVCPGE
jgi:hypothetical protein